MRVILFLFLGMWLNVVYSGESSSIKTGTEAKGFPWELVIDRGKINGCIYDNKFYSSGSILIEETLPRKCKINANRDGYWAELDERELELFETSVKTTMRLEAESVSVGNKPINKYEAALVRLMRKNSQ